nr:MAG TPA: hypothetical protein [Caudoviricetes sp.]
MHCGWLPLRVSGATGHAHQGGVPRSLPLRNPTRYVLIWKETPHVGEELRVYPHQ